ncbi:uncharacterized protein CC84DRAFT_419704 [Paraphaeosphaeria sporulosa]|uniref:Uncharacterized protein n=1 Tax=Paraphaeosphaeria sporulosa TaxID=1460663 RepID=A0A177BWD1_9PLEO|nr:uncharacterized protein CC84DRAFT_419704 [Paraphaeosphaeria sporulosa]OAF98676.1 hypothetical protein CC84DRAFT_419704 [Paraphaeosphaeria sporulosa]
MLQLGRRRSMLHVPRRAFLLHTASCEPSINFLQITPDPPIISTTLCLRMQTRNLERKELSRRGIGISRLNAQRDYVAARGVAAPHRLTPSAPRWLVCSPSYQRCAITLPPVPVPGEAFRVTGTARTLWLHARCHSFRILDQHCRILFSRSIFERVGPRVRERSSAPANPADCSCECEKCKVNLEEVAQAVRHCNWGFPAALSWAYGLITIVPTRIYV